MKEIVCNINLFSLYHSVYLVDYEKNLKEKIETTDLEELPEILNHNCWLYDTNKIHLFGEEKSLESLIEKINTLNTLHNNENKIEIEVN